MTSVQRAHGPQLALRRFTLPPGGEWRLRSGGWSLIHIEDGDGYFLQPDCNRELQTGGALLVGGSAQGAIRATQLSSLSLVSFSVMPSGLGGLLTLDEQAFFQTAASQNGLTCQILPPGHPLASKMIGVFALPNQTGLLFRLKLLQLFAEAFAQELDPPAGKGTGSDARERLAAFLKETPSFELLEMSLNELAQRIHCTPRHLSRIFRERVGMSFRDERTELRLARAQELLAGTDHKIVDIALESGYKSLSLFNLMFCRRFRASPGKWRQSRTGRQRTAVS
jgi:AraC-like DNA-binding protein